MRTNIRQVDISCHVLEISATGQDLKDDVKRAVRELKGQVRINGFRDGHVPTDLLKRIYRTELVETVTHRVADEVFNDLVKESGEYEIRYEPSVDVLEYDLDKDLKVEVAFNVLPEIDLEALRRVSVRWYSSTVSDEEMDAILERERRNHADHRWLNEEDVLELGDWVQCEVQELDPLTRTIIVGGEKQLGSMKLGNAINGVQDALQTAALGGRVGQTINFELGQENEDGRLVSLVNTDLPAELGLKSQKDKKSQFFVAKILQARREVLPPLDDAFAAMVSEGEHTSVEELRAFYAEEIQADIDRDTEFENAQTIRERMHALFPIRIPRRTLDYLSEQTGWSQADLEEQLQWEILLEAIERYIEARGEVVPQMEVETEATRLHVRDRRAIYFLAEYFTLEEKEWDSKAFLPEHDEELLGESDSETE